MSLHAHLLPLLGATLLAGCSTAQWNEMRANPREYFNLTPPTLVADARVDGQRITLQRGQALVVRLAEDPSSGQQWEIRPLPASVVIAPVQRDYTAKPGADAAPSNVAREALFRLRGIAPGTQTVALDYKQSSGAPTKSLQFDIVVR